MKKVYKEWINKVFKSGTSSYLITNVTITNVYMKHMNKGKAIGAQFSLSLAQMNNGIDNGSYIFENLDIKELSNYEIF